MIEQAVYIGVTLIILILVGTVAMLAKSYKKIAQGKALVRTGAGGIKVALEQGIIVLPILHQMEVMDISIKTIEISREQSNGLICKDNLRADIRVTFFVRVNNNPVDVSKVAQAIGCDRASDRDLLFNLFESKFSEALKTVGKRFNFVDLYNARDEFKQEVLNVIGTDLNGYVLDDCAIDYLEQTDIEHLNPNNILDSEGIKKIAELTATQKIQANQIRNEEAKRIKQQDVERQEAVLELDRQQAEAVARQKREIAIITSREEAEAEKVKQEERLKMEQARLRSEEEIGIAEQNKMRQVIVAEKNKQKTEAVEQERLEKEKQLEINERERVVQLAKIETQRALEEERRNIQDVIRERVVVEKAVVQEEEKIKDTRAFAEADRQKSVAIKLAEKNAEEALVQQLKAAEASRESAKFKAEQQLIEADAEMKSSEKYAAAKKTMADADAAKIAAQGMAEAQALNAKADADAKKGQIDANIIRAKAEAEASGIVATGEAQAKANEKLGEVDASLIVKKGLADADVLEKRMIAEAKGMDIKADAVEKYGLAEAKVLKEKAIIDAQRIKAEAEAMKAMDGVTADMERFRLQLNTQKEIELARFSMDQEMAKSQASVLAEALKTAKIDIVGGDGAFFDHITRAISGGKGVDAFVGRSQVMSELKNNILGGPDSVGERVKALVGQFGLRSEDIKNLSLSALLIKMSGMAQDDAAKSLLEQVAAAIKASGLSDSKVGNWL